VAAERHVVIAGAGIAGLTASLALARAGLRSTVLEQAEKLEETGAGIQLGPNATRILSALGVRDHLAPMAMVPHALRVMSAGSGREIVRIPLGNAVERRYGAPYWVVHRADLQAALAAAAAAEQDVILKLGMRVEDFVVHANGVTVLSHGRAQVGEERGIALIGADGIWSSVAPRLAGYRPPSFAHRTAWRALLSADSLGEEYRAPFVHLWLGVDAHLVHYPVKGGRLVNIVAIVHDEWNQQGWSAASNRDEIMRHFARWSWAEKARALVARPEAWLKWALFEGRASANGEGPVTLIGDAAHPMLPFLAQGAGMAIEDAAVLAAMLGRRRDDPAAALRRYESARVARIRRVQRTSRKQGRIYGLSGPEALVRDLGMKLVGGERLRARYNWLYNWRAPQQSESESA
jgi:salicylate hydroxylase